MSTPACSAEKESAPRKTRASCRAVRTIPDGPETPALHRSRAPKDKVPQSEPRSNRPVRNSNKPAPAPKTNEVRDTSIRRCKSLGPSESCRSTRTRRSAAAAPANQVQAPSLKERSRKKPSSKQPKKDLEQVWPQLSSSIQSQDVGNHRFGCHQE